MEINNNSLDGIIESLKKNADLIKGGAALLLGAYFISLKYYVVMDFLLFIAGMLLVFYGFIRLRFTSLQSFLRHEWFSMNYWRAHGKASKNKAESQQNNDDNNSAQQ